MDTLLHKYNGKIKGVIEGFDRIVFKGILRPICFALGMQSFLGRNNVLNKEYKNWVMDKSAIIIQDAEKLARRETGTNIQYLNSCHIRKEELAHKQQMDLGKNTGLIGVWSCLESSNTFKAAFDEAAGFSQLRPEKSRCKHLYFYYDHEEYGFMSIRLQTWAPYEIQIALNGREWLRRMLDRSGCKYIIDGNKFLDIEDYGLAQDLLNSQRGTRWIDMLSVLTTGAFPSMSRVLDDRMSYTWTLWQSEWAKDYIFNDSRELEKHMGQFLRYAFITGTGERVLRYMGKPVRENGQPHWSSKPEIVTRLSQWYDGVRIRHWDGKNSLKFYNEHNVLRFEFTMNSPEKFKIYRTVEGDDGGTKKFLPMRKGIADIAPRMDISSSRIKNFTEHMATMEEDVTVSEVLSEVSKKIKKGGKSYRALDVTGKDLDFLRAVADPKYHVGGITNKDLQKILNPTPWAKGMDSRRLSARISKHLRLLREHGLIRKLPNQHKYMLTDKGRLLTVSLNQFLGAKISDLSKLAS